MRRHALDRVSRSPPYAKLTVSERIGTRPHEPIIITQSMPRLLPSYLHTLRKQSGLSQPEMAALFDVTGSAMSRFENLSRHPTIELLIGAEVIFGQTAKDVFPAIYQDIERDIVEQARVLRDDLKSKTDPGSRKKSRLLNELIKHANAHKPAV